MTAHFTQTRGKHDDLINFSHLLQEIIDTGSFDHVDIVPVILDFDGHDIVSLLYRLYGG
jgi:hypothetical protein